MLYHPYFHLKLSNSSWKYIAKLHLLVKRFFQTGLHDSEGYLDTVEECLEGVGVWPLSIQKCPLPGSFQISLCKMSN